MRASSSSWAWWWMFKAHNGLVPVRLRDWRFQACRLPDSTDIYMNTVGTLGIRSASYWWSRPGGALVRLAYAVVSHRTPFWTLLVADDKDVEAAGVHCRPALFVVLVLSAVLRVPFSWTKVNCGNRLHWVGYEPLLAEYQAGVSESRAAWAVRWCRELEKKGEANTSEVEQGLGRISFISGMLEWDGAFLSPLYVFLNIEGPGVVRRLPGYVLLTLLYLAFSLPRRRHLSCAVPAVRDPCAIRVNARASRDSSGVGGWLPTPWPDGKISVWDSPWFMTSITVESHGWAFERGGQAFRAIAALEAYAALLGVKVFIPPASEVLSGSVRFSRLFTDNRSNGSLLTRLSTTKHPLAAITMELASELKEKRILFEAAWVPRELNSEADRLSCGDSNGFDPAKRRDVEPHSLSWHVLPAALQWGRELSARVSRQKTSVEEPRRPV